MIKRAQYKGKSIYFLEDKNKIALQMMVKQKKSRVIDYWNLASVARIFGVNLSTDEKHSLFDKKPKIDLRIVRRKDGGFMSSYKINQMNLDDFMDNKALLGNSAKKATRKNHITDKESTGETSGFLGRFLHSEVLQNGKSLYRSANISLLH